jgi:hypothetical protein
MIVLSALRTSPSFERGDDDGDGDDGDDGDDELHAVERVRRGQSRGAGCPPTELLRFSSTTGSNLGRDDPATSVEALPGQHARIDADSMTISRPVDTWASRDGREFSRKNFAATDPRALV